MTRKKKIEKWQIQTISILADVVFPDTDTFREWLENETGKRSRKDLTYSQALDVTKKLKAVRAGKTYRDHKTNFQYKRIVILAGHLSWTATMLLNYCKKQTGKATAPNMLSKADAGKVITGMQKVIAAGDKDYYNKINSSNNKNLKSVLC